MLYANTESLDRVVSEGLWRLAQWDACKVMYSCYEQTAQQRCMELMARKQQAAESMEGKFSTEGLSAMCGDDGDIGLELARTLVEQIDNGRGWQKVRR